MAYGYLLLLFDLNRGEQHNYFAHKKARGQKKKKENINRGIEPKLFTGGGLDGFFIFYRDAYPECKTIRTINRVIKRVNVFLFEQFVEYGENIVIVRLSPYVGDTRIFDAIRR